MKRRQLRNDLAIHAVLIVVLTLTLAPFAFLLNNSLRTNFEMDHAFFGVPAALLKKDWSALFQSYHDAWEALRPTTVNTLFVAAATALGVTGLGSVTASCSRATAFPATRRCSWSC